ncbi:MAG: hypothetical protein KIG57_09520, partial [Muribaculaceae bacterium]|nr:hypothetical protein [Muribaculaceae bacterium]
MGGCCRAAGLPVAVSKLRLSLAWGCPQYAGSDGGFLGGGSVPTCGFSPQPTLYEALFIGLRRLRWWAWCG